MNHNPEDLALLDTNILIYADQEQEPHHHVAKMPRDRGQQGEIPVCIAPQNLSEFFAIVTRTGRHRASNPMSPDEAIDEIRKYLECEHIYKIYPTPTTWPILLSLLGQHPVTGQDIHDLHLAATMLSNGIKRIYTFNSKDFEPIPGIEVLDPEAIDFIENQEYDEDREQEHKEEPENNETTQQSS